MTLIYLQNMLENLSDGILPSNWSDFDLAVFSRLKHLWECQQTTLHNDLLDLWK
jgi:hypothetical protein